MISISCPYVSGRTRPMLVSSWRINLQEHTRADPYPIRGKTAPIVLAEGFRNLYQIFSKINFIIKSS